MRFPRGAPGWVTATTIVFLGACDSAGEPESPATLPTARSPAADSLIMAGFAVIDAEAARIDSIFQPLPLLRPAQESGLQRFDNARQLERARALGVGRLNPPEQIRNLLSAGSLVVLEDSDQWVVRDLDYSKPYVVPAVRTLLAEISERFQARLAGLGAPAYRLEVTSVMRTAEDQEALRLVNPNAAPGESTHEYGTTVDVLNSAFAAPTRPISRVDVGDVGALVPALERYAEVAAERVAGRRAHELKAILGEVLLELQDEGRVMVTLERLQPVFHMTIASDR
jgi:hypothetical protein